MQTVQLIVHLIEQENSCVACVCASTYGNVGSWADGACLLTESEVQLLEAQLFFVNRESVAIPRRASARSSLACLSVCAGS